MEARIEHVDETPAWIIGDDEEVIIIDPGEDAASVLKQVGDREILAVICTHGHASHVAAAVEVAERDEAPVALHRADRMLWRAVHDGDDPEIEMADGGLFDVADVQLEVIHTPGHTPGSVSLYCEDLEVVFTGDTLGASGTRGSSTTSPASSPRSASGCLTCRCGPASCLATARSPRSATLPSGS